MIENQWKTGVESIKKHKYKEEKRSHKSGTIKFKSVLPEFEIKRSGYDTTHKS